MGFPVGYSEIPGLFLHVLCFLGYVRLLVARLLDTAGLGDLLDSADAPPDPPARHGRRRAALIEEALPVVRFAELPGGRRGADGCAVCLHAFEEAEEVRRLRNCRHVFHRCCLDLWMDHGSRTCPLCRAPLFGEEVPPASFDEGDGRPEDDFFAGFPPALAVSDQHLFS